MRIFFCHAGEDKPTVEQVYERCVATFPEFEGWLDRYEIVAGEDLFDKIGEGIDHSDKFFVFLSKKSIDKPWVKTELHQALMDEIKGRKAADFIVPVKLEYISTFPKFIEARKYIDLERLTEPEWLAEIEGVIRGAPVPATAGEDNLAYWVVPNPDAPEVSVMFHARHWAENIGFLVETEVPIRARTYALLERPLGTHFYRGIESWTTKYGVWTNARIERDQHFTMLMRFSEGTDLESVVTNVERWDGSDADRTVQSNIAGPLPPIP